MRAASCLRASDLCLGYLSMGKQTEEKPMTKPVVIAVVVSVLVTLGAIAGLSRVPKAKAILFG